VVLAPFLPEELVRGEWRFNDLSAGHPAPPFLADAWFAFSLLARPVLSR
jgi:hypothetical protein